MIPNNYKKFLTKIIENNTNELLVNSGNDYARYIIQQMIINSNDIIRIYCKDILELIDIELLLKTNINIKILTETDININNKNVEIKIIDDELDYYFSTYDNNKFRLEYGENFKTISNFNNKDLTNILIEKFDKKFNSIC